MKKMIIPVIMISIILSVLALPATKVYAAAEDIEKNKEDSTFQKVSDVINGKYEEKTVPFKKVTVFQSMADGIATVVRGDDTK